MRQIVLSILSLLIGMMFLMLGSGALATVIGLRMAEASWSSWVIGLVGASYYLGVVTGTGFAHRLIATVGHIRAFAAFGSIFSAAALFHGLYGDALFWAALRFFSGVCVTGLYMCVESWLNEKSDNTVRGQVFALYQAVVYLAMGLGQFVINVPDEAGFVLYIVASALLSLSIVPIALTQVSAPTPPPNIRYRLRDLFNISPLGMMTSLVAGALMGAVFSLGPVFAQQIGLSTFQVSVFMGAIIIGGFLLQYPIGRLSDIFDRRRIIAVFSGLAVVVSAIIIPGQGYAPWVLFALVGVFGGITFVLYPLAVSYTNDYLDPADMVPASAGLLIAFGIGATVGPLIGAGTMDVVGPEGLFLFSAAAAAFMTAFAIYRMTQRAAIPAEDQADFQATTSTSYMAVELDPRAEFDLTGDVPESKDSDDVEEEVYDDTALSTVTGGPQPLDDAHEGANSPIGNK